MTETLHQEARKASREAEAVLRDSWGTPQKLFDELNAEVLALKRAVNAAATAGFTVDIAAEAWNAKCAVWFGPGSPTGVQDTLTQGNIAGQDWFCNPPFSQIDKWLGWVWRWYSPQAREQGMLAGIGKMILPATRTEQVEWQTLIEPFRDKPAVAQQFGVELTSRFITTPGGKTPYGRTKFVPPAGVKPSSPQFGSVVLTWRPL